MRFVPGVTCGPACWPGCPHLLHGDLHPGNVLVYADQATRDAEAVLDKIRQALGRL